MTFLDLRKKTIVCGFAATLGALFAGECQAALIDGLTAYYDFVSDLANKAPGFVGMYTPTATGTPQAGWSGGTVTTGAGSSIRNSLIVGNALNLVDAENDFLTVALGSGGTASPGGNLGGNFTISAWHYLAPAGPTRNDRYFVFESSNTGVFDVSWGTGGGAGPNDSFTAYNSATSLSPASSLTRSTWHNVVHSFSTSGSNITLTAYVDGVQLGTPLTQPLANMDFTAIRFGDARSGAGRAWDGLLDEIAVWDRPLAASEASETYQLGLQGKNLFGAQITQPAAVPEPSTFALVGCATLVGLVRLGRCRAV